MKIRPVSPIAAAGPGRPRHQPAPAGSPAKIFLNRASCQPCVLLWQRCPGIPGGRASSAHRPRLVHTAPITTPPKRFRQAAAGPLKSVSCRLRPRRFMLRQREDISVTFTLETRRKSRVRWRNAAGVAGILIMTLGRYRLGEKPFCFCNGAGSVVSQGRPDLQAHKAVRAVIKRTQQVGSLPDILQCKRLVNPVDRFFVNRAARNVVIVWYIAACDSWNIARIDNTARPSVDKMPPVFLSG